MSNRAFLPTENCFVSKKTSKESMGIVVEHPSDKAAGNVKVKWLNTSQAEWVSVKELCSGFKPNMDVEDVPASRVRKSLGRGKVIVSRNIAGSEQVLVEFPESGDMHWLPYQNLRQIKNVEHRFIVGDTGSTEAAEKFRLRTLAHVLELWNENTGALSKLEIDPLPHQIHLVHHILASGNYNWMIADDVGLGKTIETGLLLHALKQRKELRRVLLVTPAGLTKQWQEELKYKFGLKDFLIYGEDFSINNPEHWKLHNFVIGSIDRLKDENHLAKLLQADPWDIVIFDEAHRLSRRQYGMNIKSSERFKLASHLRKCTDNMVLLTATPHQGMQDKFQALLELIRPELKNEISLLNLQPELLNKMVFRNHKADVTDAKGNFIFQGKITRTIGVPGCDEAREFDKSLSRYIRQGYDAGKSEGYKGNAIGFVMTVYRKLAASSIAAIYSALCRRKERLISERNSDLQSVGALAYEDARFLGELDENTVTSDKEFFDGELKILDSLIRDAENLMGNDQKADHFLNTLIPKITADSPQEKVLIFSEYRSTQEYLKQLLGQLVGEEKVELINGSMNHEERRKAIASFEDTGQFLISTEAGGEGINLQRKCHIIINYDLPWNPMRLVQRIGRLYRYGQKKKVIVFNLRGSQTLDEEIINLMYDRLQQVVQDMATVSGEFNDRLQEDIVGELSEALDVEDILKEAAISGIERTKDRIDDALARARTAVNLQDELFKSAASYSAADASGELEINFEHLKAFALGMFALHGIEMSHSRAEPESVWRIRLPEELSLKLGYNRRVNITTDRSLATERPDLEMLDLDSPLMKFMLSSAKEYEFQGQTAVLKYPHGLAILSGLLRWQNDQGKRMRQEFSAIQINSDGSTTTNPKELSEWLKTPSSQQMLQEKPPKKYNSQLLQVARQAALKRMAAVSNTELHPQNLEWVAGGWVTSSESPCK